MMPRYARTRGFSLIELIVVIAIIAVLSSIAIPSYRSFLERGELSRVTVTMMEVAGRLSEHFYDHGSYTADLGALGLSNTGLDSQLEGYTLSITVEEGGYVIEANGSGDYCQQITLDHTFLRSPEACWP